MAAAEGEHRLGELRPEPSGGFVAVCVCGWFSRRMPTAGLAHAAIDGHIEAPPDS
ncbi:MAG: hypothetical protein JWO37_1961 [Acidimicrobiales bacterium]|nr:hypothetical protein [Acidimicrobiales bacterium]